MALRLETYGVDTPRECDACGSPVTVKYIHAGDLTTGDLTNKVYYVCDSCSERICYTKKHNVPIREFGMNVPFRGHEDLIVFFGALNRADASRRNTLETLK